MTYEHSAATAKYLRPMTKRQWQRYRWKCYEASRGYGQRLVVWRVDGKPDIPWWHLQQIKNHALGADVCCIEVYPVQAHLVNEQNYRHLWVMPAEKVPTLWP